MNKEISIPEFKNPISAYIKKTLPHQPIYSLIAIDFLKGKITNPIKDILSGAVEKDKALHILNLTFNIGMIDYSKYQEFSEKINRLKI